MNIDADFLPFTGNHLKWITDQNVKCRTVKLLEGNIGENLNDLGYGNDLLNITPKI